MLIALYGNFRIKHNVLHELQTYSQSFSSVLSSFWHASLEVGYTILTAKSKGGIKLKWGNAGLV